ncbi:erythroblast NAD(P)(+)--arginine ADP-ribosyltransferase-like [Melozone crissalis]|uniref:erythroblast NAD(P)(+)--arginine ADP-ribosyltransferase-like n=1 Tax=Melozone crissalis TaxID=40204 RepID=UPI0023DC370D|nr:erythroblast NAD(P)(+)--arginine ADP-ribosyltransferase-like [Melozone crissalis]
MAPLAQTLTLLAMAMATTAVKVVTLDMAPYSFDDQYQGCGSAMKAALPALNNSEFEQNEKFAEVWVKAAAEWQRRGPPESPLSPEQATAIMAFTMDGLSSMFNDAVRVAGHSDMEYRDNFHFKTLHFLLTQALATLRDAQKGQCLDIFQRVCGVWFEAQHGDIIRFGEFMLASLSKPTGECSNDTVLELHTCHGMEIQLFTKHPEEKVVLIPPFETFNVTQITQEGNKTQIQLCSTGTFSEFNCVWYPGALTDLLQCITSWSPSLLSEHPQHPFPPQRTPPSCHSSGSGHQDALSHEAAKVTEVIVEDMVTLITKTP